MLGSVANLSREALLLDALIRAASESAYANIDVDRVARYAGLSSEDFYAEFEDLEHCLVASFDRYLERLRAHMNDAWESSSDWPRNVRNSILAGVEFVMQLDGASRTFLVDQSGPVAIELRMRAVSEAAAVLRLARASYPAAAHYPEIMEQTLIGGVVLGLLGNLLAEEPAISSMRSAELVELVLTPYVGSRQAHLIATEDRPRTLAYT